MAAVVALTAGGALPAAAGAEEQPAILKAYGLDWIERVRDDAWPQPKAQRPVICLLDTGVNVTPDTPADDPDGPIVARLALDGGTGVAQGTEWQHEHGTQMASIIAAPRNGYGTVGVFPQARIVSIRVTEGTETFIRPEAVYLGVRACVQFAHAADVRTAVVAIPESSYDQRAIDLEQWQSAEALASREGASIVAAAGNEPSAEPVAPFAVPGALVISAGSETGFACSFVAGVDQATALRGPGCFPSRSWPAGSSAATVATAALLAAVITRTPQLTSAEALSVLRASAVPGADGLPRLDGVAIGRGFPVAGSSEAGPTLVSTAVQGPQSDSSRQLLWRPRVRVSWSRGHLRVRRLDRHRRGRIVVEISIRGGGRRTREARHAASSFRFRVSKPGFVRVWIVSPDPGRWRSLTVRSAVR
ncbi:MAG: S8/S53 family peptidase [Solirubrobacteraceae bacterium]|nr:S8/S53 family peptidase [Solirubrobacteraceae bacterium]